MTNSTDEKTAAQPANSNPVGQAILEGRHGADLTAARLTRLANLPASWDEQRRLLGFGQ